MTSIECQDTIVSPDMNIAARGYLIDHQQVASLIYYYYNDCHKILFVTIFFDSAHNEELPEFSPITDCSITINRLFIIIKLVL